MLVNLITIKRFLQWVTFRRVILLFLAALVWIFSYTLFENRSEFIKFSESSIPLISKHEPLKISSQTERLINKIVEENSDISFILVVDADMYRNTRMVVDWASFDPVVFVEIESFLNKNGFKAPLLGQNNIDNAAIIRAINGEFNCGESTDSLIVSNISKYIKQVCRASIPPYYGNFTGYVAIGINKKLTPERTANVRRIAVELSSAIHFDNLSRIRTGQ